MKTLTCPSCGHQHQTVSARKALVTATPNADMTDKELYAFYKKTAPANDVAFVLRTAMSPSPRTAFEALAAAHLPRTEHYRQYGVLLGRWRDEANTREERERQNELHVVAAGLSGGSFDDFAHV